MKLFLKEVINGEVIRSSGDYAIESLYLLTDNNKLIERICRIEVDEMKEVAAIYNMFAGSIPFLRNPLPGKALLHKQVWVGEMAQYIVRSIILFNQTEPLKTSGAQNL